MDNRVWVTCDLCHRSFWATDRALNPTDVRAMYLESGIEICLICHINNQLKIILNPIKVLQSMMIISIILFAPKQDTKKSHKINIGNINKNIQEKIV